MFYPRFGFGFGLKDYMTGLEVSSEEVIESSSVGNLCEGTFVNSVYFRKRMYRDNFCPNSFTELQ